MLKNLPEGQYCLFASAKLVGWLGAYGIIVIYEAGPEKKSRPSQDSGLHE